MPARPDLDFDSLVQATAPGLHRTALLLTGGDHHLAEDLLQSTYAKVWVAWKRVSRADDPVAYTRTILTRTFLSHRRLRRSSERPSDDLHESTATSQRDPALRLDMVEALHRLAPKDRAVVVHRYWLDRSVADTATDLGLTEVVVRTRSKRALARLRAQLGDLDIDPRDNS
jgi:RNA polymerase sigma-70 factor (sigma-E family)